VDLCSEAKLFEDEIKTYISKCRNSYETGDRHRPKMPALKRAVGGKIIQPKPQEESTQKASEAEFKMLDFDF